jgi:hypothetical protein
VPRPGLFPRFILVMSVLFCGATICAVVCAQQQTSGVPKESTVLHGTVVNAVTHQPVSRALVETQDGRFATMTNERGQFQLVFKEKKTTPASNAGPGGPGNATMTFFPTPITFTTNGGTSTFSSGPSVVAQTSVDRPSYLTARRVGFINTVFQGNPGVAIAPDQEEVTIPIIPEARVIGRVTLADGEPPRGMQVSLYRRMEQGGQPQWRASGQAEVKSDGEFRFADLEAGDYKVFSLELSDRDPITSDPRGQQFGYPPDYYPSATDFAGGALIHLSAGETFQLSLTPERRRYYPVHIGIVNRQASDMPQVEVWRDGHPGPGYALGFDFRDGSISGMLPDGNYIVRVRSESENALTGLTNLSVKGAPAIGMVTLMGGMIVGVQVREEFGNSEPMQEAEIRAIKGDPSVSGRQRRVLPMQVALLAADEFSYRQPLMAQPSGDPDAEGLEIRDVPAGEYRVSVQTQKGYVASVRCGGTDLQKSSLVVAAGTTLPPVEVVLRDDGGEVDGSVTELANRNREAVQGVSMPAAYVLFLPEGGGDGMQQANVQQNGEFQMPQLPPGTYRVLAFERPRSDLAYSNEELLKKYEAQIVTVGPAEKVKIRISLSKD